MQAFAPASVTAVFTPTESGDGSRGVSFALADGVTVAVDPAAETTVSLDGQPTDFAPVEGVLDRLGVTAAVDVRPEVPIGSGFGVSGAATLATALAAAAEFELDRTREELLDAAHRSEVAAGTGLGDVFVQERGGVVYDLGDGKGKRRVDHDERVAYASFGAVSTEGMLNDPETMRLVREHGTAALAGFSDPPVLRTVLDDAWSFAQATGLATERVAETVATVRAAGGIATMAMVGETVVAVGADDVPDEVLDGRSRVANEGARVL